MSVRVVVYRSPCVILAGGTPCDECRPAPSVTSPLVSTPEVALAAGMAILDAEGHDWQPVTAEIPAEANMMPGEIIERLDHEGSYKAQLESITYTIKINAKEFTADASLAVKRIADD